MSIEHSSGKLNYGTIFMLDTLLLLRGNLMCSRMYTDRVYIYLCSRMYTDRVYMYA